MKDAEATDSGSVVLSAAEAKKCASTEICNQPRGPAFVYAAKAVDVSGENACDCSGCMSVVVYVQSDAIGAADGINTPSPTVLPFHSATGECVLSQSRNALSMRVCQPRPVARNAASTSGL